MKEKNNRRKINTQWNNSYEKYQKMFFGKTTSFITQLEQHKASQIMQWLSLVQDGCALQKFCTKIFRSFYTINAIAYTKGYKIKCISILSSC